MLCRLSTSLVICHESSIATEHIREKSEKPTPLRLLLYDATPGGTGISEAVFDQIDNLMQKAMLAINSCKCENGCTACIFDLTCKEYNNVLDKASTQMMLTDIMTLKVGQSSSSSESALVEPNVPPTPVRKRLKAMTKAKELGRAKNEQFQITKPWFPHFGNHCE